MVTLTGKGTNMPAQKVKININGFDVEGHPEELAKLANALGVPFNYQFDQTKWHWSESKQEWVFISDMPTQYLWNAFVKVYREAQEDIFTKVRSKEYSTSDAINELINFPNPLRYGHLSALYRELHKRFIAGNL